MPDPITVGALVAAALAAGATEAGKAVLGQAARDAYAALASAATRVVGPMAASLAGKPESTDLAAVNAQPADIQSELRSLAEALKAALPAEGRASIDNRVTVIASGAGAMAAGRDLNIGSIGSPPGKP
jgi:hypothetical protein